MRAPTIVCIAMVTTGASTAVVLDSFAAPIVWIQFLAALLAGSWVLADVLNLVWLRSLVAFVGLVVAIFAVCHEAFLTAFASESGSAARFYFSVLVPPLAAATLLGVGSSFARWPRWVLFAGIASGAVLFGVALGRWMRLLAASFGGFVLASAAICTYAVAERTRATRPAA